MAQPGEPERDWVDRVSALAGRLGMNPVRVRWKLEGWRRRTAAAGQRASQRVAEARYPHQFCPECGALVDQSDSTCVRCGARLPSRVGQVARRAGFQLETLLTAERFLLVSMVLPYLWVLTQGESSSVLDLSPQDLVRWGGNYPPLTLAGQWWRLASYMFLHGGLMHLGFNAYALHIVAPAVEEFYGWTRCLLAFWITAVLAGVASLFFTGAGVSIGASGGLMGLIGLLGTWGHRSGTGVGRNVRNQMIRWTLYTGVFGYFIGADNAAHAGGLLAGIGLGFVFRPARIAGARAGSLWSLIRGLVPLLLLATLASIPLTPTLERALALGRPARGALEHQDLERAAVALGRACDSWRAGQRAPAAAAYAASLADITGRALDPQTVASYLEAACPALAGEPAGPPALGAPTPAPAAPAADTLQRNAPQP